MAKEYLYSVNSTIQKINVGDTKFCGYTYGNNEEEALRNFARGKFSEEELKRGIPYEVFKIEIPNRRIIVQSLEQKV